MADTPTGETAADGTLNPGGTTTTPTTPPDNGSQPDAEQLRKQAEQATMRANQLQKELDRKTKAEEDAAHKRLEENEEYKTLAEKYQSDLEEERRVRESENKDREIKSETSAILSKYPSNVREIAETAGLSLNDTTDDAKTTLAAKLDEIQKRAGTTSPVTSNNPTTPNAPDAASQREGNVQRMRLNNVSNKVHNDAFHGAIRGLDTIKAMKEQSGFTPENV